MTRTSLAIFLGILLIPGMLSAGEWHIAGALRCGDCHLQHASSQLAPVEGGFSYMLKKNSVNELCLSCHDGSDPTAPDVAQPVQMYSATTSQESGAGHFTMTGFDNLAGHSIGLITTTPLQGLSQSQELNCASCHAVHGNANYRNLLHDPANIGANIQVTDGSDVLTLQKPTIPPSAAGSTTAYERDNIAYLTSQISTWCVACHDQLANNSNGAYPAHFNGHPSDVALNEYSVDAHTDVSHWLAGVGEGFTPGVGDGIRRVPYLAPQATTFIHARIPQGTNQVACVSCHKAHGSSNQKGMLWPYVEGGTGAVSGCQQCHNK